MAGIDEMEFVVEMARIAREDRDLYRKLRAEAWDLVKRNHEKQNDDQRAAWLRSAS